MARCVITPTRARAYRRHVVLSDARGALLFIHMPNAEGARFCAAALNQEFRRARRAGE